MVTFHPQCPTLLSVIKLTVFPSIAKWSYSTKSGETSMANRPIGIGEPAPWFSAIFDDNPDAFLFDELAGRYIVLFFYCSASRPDVAEVFARIDGLNDLFDNEYALFLGINKDPVHNLVRERHAGRRNIWDPNGGLSRLYGIADQSAAAMAFIISPTLQIIDRIPLNEPVEFVNRVVSALRSHLPSPMSNPPILIVPQLFDSSLCRELIDVFDSTGGRETGFAANIDGQVVSQIDHKIKRRFDCAIADEELRLRIKDVLERRLLIMVYRAFQFRTTWIERYMVGCYDGASGGYFRPHRDNTTSHTAHRRFALTINLNEDYEGGDLRFPEFGPQSYRPPPGGALVFSCSLLHEAMPVASGRRYAFLSFLCNEAKPVGLRGISPVQRSTLAASLKLPPGPSVAIRIAHDPAVKSSGNYAAELRAGFIGASGWNVQSAAVMNPALAPPTGLGVLVADPVKLTPMEKVLVEALTRAEIAHDVLPNCWMDVGIGLLVVRPIGTE
jgi:hypothetical protein